MPTAEIYFMKIGSEGNTRLRNKKTGIGSVSSHTTSPHDGKVSFRSTLLTKGFKKYPK